MTKPVAECDELSGCIIPNWPAPDSVRALCTTRRIEQGYSAPPFDKFNVAEHVGDESVAVIENRKLLPPQYYLVGTNS